MEQLDFSFPIFNFPQIFKNRFFFLKLYTPGNVRLSMTSGQSRFKGITSLLSEINIPRSVRIEPSSIFLPLPLVVIVYCQTLYNSTVVHQENIFFGKLLKNNLFSPDYLKSFCSKINDLKKYPW